MKLLEGIGAVSSAEGKKAASRAGNYQDAATASLNRDFDNDAATQDDIEADKPGQLSQEVFCCQWRRYCCIIRHIIDMV